MASGVSVHPAACNVPAKRVAGAITGSMSDEPSSVNAHARMAGHVSFCAAAMIEIAMHSSRQNVAQSSGATSMRRAERMCTARTHSANACTAGPARPAGNAAA